jgi:hypothetical protein
VYAKRATNYYKNLLKSWKPDNAARKTCINIL